MFGKEDILNICKQCLEPMFKVTDDKFFDMLYTNYAMIIYKIIDLPWEQDPTKEEQKISLRRLKKNICQAEGYEKDMLALVYGSTGIMNLDTKTQFIEQKDLKEVGKTAPSVIQGYIPAELGVSADISENEEEFIIDNKNSDLQVGKMQLEALTAQKGKRILKIGPEMQSKYTQNINMRKHAISQLLQDDREL